MTVLVAAGALLGKYRTYAAAPLKLVPPNGIYGLRTSATPSTPEIWYSANAFMGWALLVASTTSISLLLKLPETEARWRMRVASLTPVVLAVAISFAYLARLA
jgi:hypothetical protein